jgi:hypothetical protein
MHSWYVLVGQVGTRIGYGEEGRETIAGNFDVVGRFN